MVVRSITAHGGLQKAEPLRYTTPARDRNTRTIERSRTRLTRAADQPADPSRIRRAGGTCSKLKAVPPPAARGIPLTSRRAVTLLGHRLRARGARPLDHRVAACRSAWPPTWARRAGRQQRRRRAGSRVGRARDLQRPLLRQGRASQGADPGHPAVLAAVGTFWPRDRRRGPDRDSRADGRDGGLVLPDELHGRRGRRRARSGADSIKACSRAASRCSGWGSGRSSRRSCCTSCRHGAGCSGSSRSLASSLARC